jgi:hypothetical protein
VADQLLELRVRGEAPVGLAPGATLRIAPLRWKVYAKAVVA